MANSSEIITLHRYFIWANKMRTDFDALLAQRNPVIEDENKLNIESNIYMSYWYGGLYVVIEGWLNLKLSDPVIDSLLNSDNVGLLKRYRNGVFHFQKKYYDNRFLDFITEGENTVEWVRNLNREFGRWFLEWFDKMKQNPTRA